MNIWVGFAVAALKAGVSEAVENKMIRELISHGFQVSSEKLKQYLEKAQEEINYVLSDKSMTEMKVPHDQTVYLREEISGLIQNIGFNDVLLRSCRYDAESLAEALYSKYIEGKKTPVEYENEIRKILSVMSQKAIQLEKERDGFIEDSMIHVMNAGTDQMELLREILRILLDTGIKDQTDSTAHGSVQRRKKRLPDRTADYLKKWNENMFLNDFDEDDENAGVNIPLNRLYQLPFYQLRDRTADLSNLEGRIEKCVQGQDWKTRMLLILGQPGMGKSTMITWFLNWYQKRRETDKKEILVYRFTDLSDADWSVDSGEEKSGIGGEILKCLNMEKEDLDGKILILDGFDEISVMSSREKILNSLYHAWVKDTKEIKDFSLLITCRENYIEDLSRLTFPYITLQPWDEEQIRRFCRNYQNLTKSQVSEEAVNKMEKMRDVFGIPLILYMTLALKITVRNDSSVVEVYDQIFSLEKGGLYERCLRRDASVRWDDEHRIAEIKRQIHQFSREISMWMFENNPEKAAIPKKEYEKIRDQIFEEDGSADGAGGKNDVLIGNYFRMVRCYDGINAEELTFIHRSIYEYFVVELIGSEIREPVEEMTEAAQEKLAGVLGDRLKEGKIDYTIGQYLKTKVSMMTAAFSREKKKQFYAWLEGAAGKMLDAGMLYYTGKNIREYRNVIRKEINCFSNLLELLRLFLDFSEQKYILCDIEKDIAVLYIRYAGSGSFWMDLSKAYLKKANLSKVNLSNLNLEGTDLGYANLSGADLRGANLSRAQLGGADLSGADLSEANLSGADLSGTDLSRAVLARADLSRSNLRRSNLIEADLRQAALREADLTSSDLSRALLIGVDLRETNLKDVNLIKADLEQTRWRQKDIVRYMDSIIQAEFSEIYRDAENFGETNLLTREMILSKKRGGNI